MNNFYVYIYYRLDTNEPFYVGKGKGGRWNTLSNRSTHFKNIANKYPIVCEIIKDNLTEDEAHGIECWLINELVFEYGYSIDIPKNRSKNENNYHLCNQTWGGEGTSGHNPYENKTEEEMEIIKEKCKHCGENNYWYGKSLRDFMTDEQWRDRNKKISESHKGKKGISRYGKDNPNFNNYWTDEQKQLQREKMKGKFDGEKNPFYGKHHSEKTKRKLGKAVICLTTKKIFYTTIEASQFYKCDNSVIVKCCKGKRKSAGKYNGTSLKWKYLVWKHNKKYRIKKINN